MEKPLNDEIFNAPLVDVAPVKREIQKDELRLLYRVRAPYAGRCFLCAITPGLFRLTFAEQVGELKDELVPVSAVTLTAMDLISLVNMANQLMIDVQNRLAQMQKESVEREKEKQRKHFEDAMTEDHGEEDNA